MTAADIIAEIEPLGLESYRKVIRNHGVVDPLFGVKIEELKKIQKRIKKDYKLALDLYDTGIYDAQYLAGLIADDLKMTKADLQHWLETANSHVVTESTVAWVAAESYHGAEVAMEWIESDNEIAAATGWATLNGLVAIKKDNELDVAELKRLLGKVASTIHEQPNRVRRCMNSFVIAVGTYVKELTETAIETAGQIGKVYVDVGATSCKVPSAAEYIEKSRQRGSIGKKRSTIKC